MKMKPQLKKLKPLWKQIPPQGVTYTINLPTYKIIQSEKRCDVFNTKTKMPLFFGNILWLDSNRFNSELINELLAQYPDDRELAGILLTKQF